MKRKTIKRVILFIVAIVFLIVIRPLGFLLYNYIKDDAPFEKNKTGYTNDASYMNNTRIDSVVIAREGIEDATKQISDLIKQAKAEGKKISIAGAKHSMGGHTIYPDGIVLDMKSVHYMKFDSINNILLVGSGALWSEIVPFLDAIGKSVVVMQSNNSFSVGGSISVNCHGWQPNSPPIASTVESFRLINSDGVIINCSRSENAELFSLVLGGYGLFGVILDVKLRVVDNKMYINKPHIIRSDDYVNEFDKYVEGNTKVGMAYGRININPDNFMQEAIISTFIDDGDAKPQPIGEGKFVSLRRTVFRSSANSDYGKNLRWKAEKFITNKIDGKLFSRNQLINEGVDVFENTDTNYTDILHEYFIPKKSVGQFIKAVREIIPTFKVDLLNITVRNVKKDDDSFLSYAHNEVFGFVMLFNQAKTKEAENEMKALTQKLIDVAISLKGTYYLPYRLHATREQMHTAYYMADEFFKLKVKYDSLGVFRNKFYETYK